MWTIGHLYANVNSHGPTTELIQRKEHDYTTLTEFGIEFYSGITNLSNTKHYKNDRILLYKHVPIVWSC